jgi:hypothetical protein
VRENALYSLSLQVAKRDRWQYEHGVAAKYIPDKFAWKFSSDRWFVAIPHWFAAAVLGAATVCASLIRWRFSLRTLLITTTLVAVVLGVVAVLS